MQANETLDILAQWQQAGLIRAVDLSIARFLHRRDTASNGLVLLAGALASYQYGMGHTCLDPQEFLKSAGSLLDTRKNALVPGMTRSLSPDDLASTLLAKDWYEALEASPLVGKAAATAPLVLDGERVYLARNWDHEQRIATSIRERLHGDTGAITGLSETLNQLFPNDEEPHDGNKPAPTNWQKVSAALATEGRFLILTGGPGTGKTYTVARILALLQKDRPQRILLAAPTGKAAARLSESIASAIDSIPADLRQHSPGKAITLHQMLGASRHGRRYRHDEDTPLQADVVVIDEASMIDLEMMAAILRALPPKTRLILVGDKDQLASVEAGSVLGDLCRNVESRGYTSSTCERIRTLSGEHLKPSDPATADPLAQRTVMLRYSKRFDANSGIGLLAHAINEGRSDDVLRILDTPPEPLDIKSLEFKAKPDPRNFGGIALGIPSPGAQTSAAIITGYGHYLELLRASRPGMDATDTALTDWAKSILDAYTRFQILCAVRQGEWGVQRINELVEGLLATEQHIEQNRLWYEGRPVMMTRNDYELGIMNGDVGITLAFPNRERTGTVLKVVFRNEDNTMKFVLPSRLSEAETVYAMTIHKSQGSEFEHAALVFPDKTDSPIMTRELIYTGVTRAKKQLTVICPNKSELAQSVTHPIRRSGRLSELLGLPAQAPIGQQPA